MFYYYDVNSNYIGCGLSADDAPDGCTATTTPPPEKPKTNDEIIVDLTKALEDHYDSKAREKRYDNRLTCALRAGYTGPFQADGMAFAQWMDSCNAYGYQVMADCLAGARLVPAPEELIAELPVLTWPV